MGAKFNHWTQKAGESIREYTLELKQLYKANPDRDKQKMTEDLLCRFLDGLRDDSSSFHVEYVKTPMNIDEAVNEIINFVETMWAITDGSDDEGDEMGNSNWTDEMRRLQEDLHHVQC